MKIDITQLPLVLSSCEKKTHWERAEKTAQMLINLGFQFPYIICGRASKDYHREVNENVIRALNQYPVPFLFMEDDAVVLEDNYSPILEIPDECDVLYLGGGVHAYAPYIDWVMRDKDPSIKLNRALGYNNSRVVYKDINQDYVRLYSMYSSHAVLFLTEEGVSTFLSAVMRKRSYPFDVTFSFEMVNLNVYMVRNPLFYQADGYNDLFTKKVIYDNPNEPIIDLIAVSKQLGITDKYKKKKNESIH